MRLRTVDVLGGGPGGLYTARLLKLRDPECRVAVYEQSEPASTFGFGVGLATGTQRNLEAADRETFEDIVAHSWRHQMSMSVDGRRVMLPDDNLMAIGRSTLLDVLRRHAARVGVELHDGARVRVDELDADLVVAADGIGSATREARAEEYGAQIRTHDSLYLWAGTDVALPSAVFTPVRTEHGCFVAHAYPYAADRSTFLIETDEEAWRRSGFDVNTDRTPFDESDTASLEALSSAFGEHLHGHRLIGNRTRWMRFRTIRCRHWHVGNVALLGDAVHTAHYSIGSGTKLAMEDGIALVDAIATADDLESALAAYESLRRPPAEHLQETATRSMRWWDSFPGRLDLPIERLWVAYMTRAGKVSVDRFAAKAPDVVRGALAQYAGTDEATVDLDDVASWVLSRRLERRGRVFAGRRAGPGELAGLLPVTVEVDDPWGPQAQSLVKHVVDACITGSQQDGVLLTCAPGMGAVLTMFDVAERLRQEADMLVVATVPEALTDLAVAALVSGRVDLVDLVPEDAR